MSPRKPDPAFLARSRPSNRTLFSIPRRAVPSKNILSNKSQSSTAEQKKPKSKSSRPAVESIFSDNTATTKPANVVSYFAQDPVLSRSSDAANKENMPLPGVARSTFRSRAAGSPTRGKIGVTKSFKYSPPAIRTGPRAPLRELSRAEVFERDDCVLGDIRRRRSGEHHEVEITSFHAIPSPTTANSIRGSSVSSAFTDETEGSLSTNATEPNDVSSSFGVLRSESHEELQRKVDSLMASISSSTNLDSSKKTTPGKKAGMIKAKHPAVRTSTSSIDSLFGLDDPGLAESPVPKSPVLARRSASPIAKPSPSPVRIIRPGLLGLKSTNLLLAKDGNKEGKKLVFSASNNHGLVKNVKRTLGKRAGANSLRRAAGTATARPALTTSVRQGLDGLKFRR